jgi:hypothetical protein
LLLMMVNVITVVADIPVGRADSYFFILVYYLEN